MTLAKSGSEAYDVVATVMIQAAEDAAEQPPWWDADVLAHERRTMDVAVLQVRPRTRYDYLPGQSLSLETEIRPRLWRYYSPANAPARTDSSSSTSRRGTAARSAPLSSAASASATCSASAHRWETSPWSGTPTATSSSSPADWAWRP